jgi:hypothetical protein
MAFRDTGKFIKKYVEETDQNKKLQKNYIQEYC